MTPSAAPPPSLRGAAPQHIESDPNDLYGTLGVQRGATDIEIRRAYRNLLTRAHPDKGGDPERFRRIQTAYDVLSEPGKRKLYDETGRVEKTPDQEFVEYFANGAFRDPILSSDSTNNNTHGSGGNGSLADLIIVRHRSGEQYSHTAGFEAWLRSRGDTSGTLFTADTVAEQFGVARNSYDPVLLPRGNVLQVVCHGPPGAPPRESLSLESAPLPLELEWGRVLVAMKFAPINAADTYTARLGGVYGSNTAPNLPYVAGHDGVGVVLKMGPGVKSLSEGDLVVPLRPFLGTWATACVVGERDVVRLPPDGYGLPLEYLAMCRELCVAYQLLEGAGLQPGDALLLNAATSTVGAVVLQLSRLLRLRAVAVVARKPRQGPPPPPLSPPQHHHHISGLGGAKPPATSSPLNVTGEGGGGGGDGSTSTDKAAVEADWRRTVTRLRDLGATEVLADEGSLRAELDRLRFFSRPRLALDAVGGESATRLVDALAEGAELVVYGCMSGRPPALSWQTWVFRDVRVRGFNLRRALAAQPSRLAAAVQQLAKLVGAGLLSVPYTEYDITEWSEALDHAQERGKATKVLLRMKEPWFHEEGGEDGGNSNPFRLAGASLPTTTTTAAAAVAATGGRAAATDITVMNSMEGAVERPAVVAPEGEWPMPPDPTTGMAPVVVKRVSLEETVYGGGFGSPIADGAGGGVRPVVFSTAEGLL